MPYNGYFLRFKDFAAKTLNSIILNFEFQISAITLDCKNKHTTYYTLYQTFTPFFMRISGLRWGYEIVCTEGVVLDNNCPLLAYNQPPVYFRCGIYRVVNVYLTIFGKARSIAFKCAQIFVDDDKINSCEP